MAKTIVVNGEKILMDCSSVQQLAEHLQLPERGVALALNNRVMPRPSWGDTALNENDNVTIIKATFGG